MDLFNSEPLLQFPVTAYLMNRDSKGALRIVELSCYWEDKEHAYAIKRITGILYMKQTEQPIIYSEKQRGENFNYLNRHQIMHGESLDYGTEINSYKVISLLLYIVQVSEIIEGE